MRNSLTIQKGQYRGKKIDLPPRIHGKLNLTPNIIKEAVFQLLEGRLGSDPSSYAFFDLCGGSGQMAMEAYSLGYSPVHISEVDRDRFQFLMDAVRNFGFSITLHRRDFRRMAAPILEVERSVLYIDPPYSFWTGGKNGAVERLLFNLSRIPAPGGGRGQAEEGSSLTPGERRILIVIQGPSPYEGEGEKIFEEGSWVEEHSMELRDYRKNWISLLSWRGNLPSFSPTHGEGGRDEHLYGVQGYE